MSDQVLVSRDVLDRVIGHLDWVLDEVLDELAEKHIADAIEQQGRPRPSDIDQKDINDYWEDERLELQDDRDSLMSAYQASKPTTQDQHSANAAEVDEAA